MKTFLAAVLFAALFGFCASAPGADAADRAPLLMEGKKTLYQRVLSRPGALLRREPAGPGAEQPAMTRFYV